MSWDTNHTIRFKLGTIALWNLLTQRRVIDGGDPSLALIKTHAPDQFEELTKAPLPSNLEARYARA
jgi:hypothetical protein